MFVTKSSIAGSLATGAIACLMGVLTAGAGGCAGSAEVPPGEGLVERGPISLSPVSGGELRAAAGSRGVFLDPTGLQAGTKLVIERSPVPGGDESTYGQKRILINGSDEKVIREQTLRLLDDGSVVLVEEINHTEGVEVVFEPPMVVLPVQIREGELPASEGRMTVHPLGDRSRVRAKGPVRNTANCEGAFQVSTPAGLFDAWKLTSTLSADLGPSKVQNETVLWLVPGIGLIAERREEKTTVMGIPVRSNSETWVIHEAPAAAMGAGR